MKKRHSQGMGSGAKVLVAFAAVAIGYIVIFHPSLQLPSFLQPKITTPPATTLPTNTTQSLNCITGYVQEGNQCINVFAGGGSGGGGGNPQTNVTLYSQSLNLTQTYTEIIDDTTSDIIGEESTNSGLVGDTITTIKIPLAYLTDLDTIDNNDTVIIGVFDDTTGAVLYQFRNFTADTMTHNTAGPGPGVESATYYNATGSYTIGEHQVIGTKLIPTGNGSVSTRGVVTGFFQPITNSTGINEDYNGGGFFIDTTNQYVMILIGNTP